MHFLLSLTMLFLLCGSIDNAEAANEWKDPDQQAAPIKKRTVPPPPPARAAVPLQSSAPATASVLEGQLSLETLRICEYQLSYVDKGSGGKIDGSFYLPIIPHGFYMVGAYAQGNYHRPTDCVLAVKPANSQSTSLLQAPLDWQRIWKDKGSGASMDGSIWHPSPQSSDYICLGGVAQQGYRNPVLRNYACVHRCLVENIPVANPVWSTKGTGANQKAYVYKLHNSNSFFVLTGKNRPTHLQDLKGQMNCSF